MPSDLVTALSAVKRDRGGCVVGNWLAELPEDDRGALLDTIDESNPTAVFRAIQDMVPFGVSIWRNHFNQQGCKCKAATA